MCHVSLRKKMQSHTQTLGPYGESDQNLESQADHKCDIFNKAVKKILREIKKLVSCVVNKKHAIPCKNTGTLWRIQQKPIITCRS